MVASDTGATDPGTGRAGRKLAERPNKPPLANCGPMMQQGTMGAHGHEMHPQGFLRLVGCHETNRQSHGTARRVHA